MTTVGASAAALHLGVLDFAATLFAAEPPPPKRPRICGLFVRPDSDRYWMSWPGASFDVEANQAKYSRTLTEAAKQFDIQLELQPVPLHDPDTMSEVTAQLRQSPPDGILVTIMHEKLWPQINYLARERGPAPLIVFSPLGTAFPSDLQATRNAAGTFVAAGADAEWLATGMRMLRSAWDMKAARLCLIGRFPAKDVVLAPLGTTLHYLPLERWLDAYRQAERTAEMQAVADYYQQEAKKIVEPRRDDLLEAAKNYVVARRIMRDEQCQGISVDCYPVVNDRRTPCGPCVAWSRLLDEGLVGACEADADAAVTMLLSQKLLGRPGFMQDPAVNTIRNTVIGSHCTCPTKLEGPSAPHAPFVLRNHFESASGVAVQVLWRPEQEVTLAKFRGPAELRVGTGRVVDNVERAAEGGCRTAIEIKLDQPADARDLKGYHQVIVCGKHDGTLRAFAELSGIRILPI